jgi:2',3'-cyclic-nucleotide 2'-phosphodiesterase (5'-nucleotidase family)
MPVTISMPVTMRFGRCGRSGRRVRLANLGGLLVWCAFTFQAPEAARGGEAVHVAATGSNKGEVDPCGCKTNPKGGIARRATLIDSLRTVYPGLLLFDAGGIVHPDKKKGEHTDPFILSAMNRMRYDAVTLGQIELERGEAAAKKITGELNAKVVLSNAKPKTGQSPWAETTVITAGDQRVGLLGLVSQSFGNDPLAFEKAGFTVEDPFAAVERLVPALRSQADVIVVLAHLQQEDLDRLTKTAGKGIDLVIAGHNSYVMSTQPEKAVTTLLRPGQRGEYLGLAHLEAAGGKEGRAKAKVESIMLEVKKFRDDQALAAQLEAIKAQSRSD